MKIRAALVAFLLALMAVPVAHAQERAQGGERRMQMMFKDITLTAAQKTKVDSIIAHYRAEMGPMNQSTRPDSAAMAHRRTLMQKQTADIRAQLTREQQPVFDRNLEGMKNERQRRQGGQ